MKTFTEISRKNSYDFLGRLDAMRNRRCDGFNLRALRLWNRDEIKGAGPRHSIISEVKEISYGRSTA